MAALSNAEPRRSYSWWWDSHIIPKHSKWLQGNLADMDGKVKALIKLIHEDADSFAKRAEMYYKKRPELIKLVEEFYRAYRALAERYDHATGALHQAQRTMAEAFPNQFPLEFFDECISLDVGTISHESARGSSQSNGIHLDPLGLPLQRDAVKLKEAPKEACLNQLNQMNASGEEVAGANFAEGGEGKFMEYKLLQKEISRLSKENQDLKKQVTLESARADRNESEVQRMKETCLKVKCEKEDSLSRYLESMTRVSDLEDEISCTKADIEKLNDEMMKGTLCLNNAQQRSLVLQKANQSLEFELNVLKKKIEQQQEELNKKEQEVSVLNSSLQSELQRSEKAEIACKSVEKLQSESLEEIMHLEIELKSEVEKLKDVQKELEKMREENLKLSEQELSSALKIMSLQDEIISLMDLIRKLEDETDLHIEEKESLEIQLYRIRKERDDLEEKYHTLMEEVQAVNLSVESLHALIEDLRNANLELKDTIKKNEDERNLYLHNLSNMQTMSNKIPALEVSLWDANQEITRLRMKIKELEDSSAHLCCRISIHLAEKAALLSQMHAATQNMENLSKRNAFLDNSLFDMNVEVEDLRGKLKNVEESCKSLQDEKYNLLSEKSVLMSQVEGFKHSLQMLEGRYSELEGKSSNLEKDKDVTLYQMAELQELLRLKKEEHSILFQSGKSQLSAMANQMCLLQEQGRQREEDFEMQQQQIINAQIEIFILQRCLCDMKGENFILTCKYEEHYDALKSAGKLIQGLEQKYETQETKMKSLIENNKKLRGRIHVIIRSLKMDLENVSLDDTKDELLLQLIFSEVKQMLLAISEAQDEKQRLLLDKSVVVTLLKQYGKYVTDLRAEKDILERESEVNAQKFTQLKSNNDELVEMTELLRKDMQASKQQEEALQEEALRSEVDLLFRQLTYLQGFCSSLQIDYSKVLEENNAISRKLNSLREDKAKLGEDNIDLLKDFIALDCLSVVFRSLNSERELTLQHISKERIDFYKMKNKLEQEISLINGKILILEVENTHLKESFANLNVCRRNLFGIQHDVSHSQSINELNRQAYTWENALARDDLSQTNHILKDMKPDTCRNVNDIKLDVYNAKLTRAGREKISALLDDCGSMENKIECLPLENCRRFELHEFAEEMEELLYVVQFERINAVMYKDKVLELMKVCENIETGAKAQTEILRKEITSKNSAVTELDRKIYVLEGENRQLKADLNEYSLFWGSLWDDVAILEELILSLARRHSTSTRQELEDDQEPCSNTVTMQEELDNYNATEPTEKLQNLHDKVKLLQEVLMDTGSVLELERLESSASLETAWREIEGLKLKKVRDNEIKITKSKCDQIIKDIQLDIVLNSSRYRNSILSRGLRKAKDSDEVTEQMLELLGRYEEGCSNQKQKGPLMIENDLADHQIEEMEAKYTSDELVAEKELGVDKLELPPKVDSCQEWNRKVIERLFSDAQRLLLLQSSLRDLQKNMETSEKVNQPTRSEFNAVKVQLTEAQTTISQLIEVNSNLTKKVEDFSDDLVERKESGGKRHKQISDRARKVSEKIGRLELEMQKIQYNLMKFEEEHPSKRTRIVKRRPVIRLREYIYGRRNSKRQKEGSSCGCMRPAEISD